MTEVTQSSDLEFQEVVLLLTNECIRLFMEEASELEINLWVEKIPQRFPQFKIGRLLAAIKKLLNAKIG